MKKGLTTLFADMGLLYAAAIWGATFYMIKDNLDFIDPVVLTGYRFTLAAFILGVVLKISGRNILEKWKQGLTLGFVLWILYLPQTVGLKYTTASNSAFITGLFVAFLPFFYFIFLKRPPALPRVIAVVISLAGLWLLTGGLAEVNIGDMMTIITAAAYALHIMFVDKFVKQGVDPYIISFQQFAVVGILSLITGAVFALPFNIASGGAFWLVVFLAVFPTITAFVVQTVSQKFTTPLKVSLILSMEPVFAAIFAWTLGSETFIAQRAVGGLLIVAAILISEFSSFFQGKKAEVEAK